MPKAEQVSEGKRHTKTQGEVLQIKTLLLGKLKLALREHACSGKLVSPKPNNKARPKTARTHRGEVSHDNASSSFREESSSEDAQQEKGGAFAILSAASERSHFGGDSKVPLEEGICGSSLRLVRLAIPASTAGYSGVFS